MGKFDGVLLASDYDGTLYDDNGIITDGVRSAIAYYISEGGLFTVSTGRTYQGFHDYDAAYINAPALLANGAMAYDYSSGNILFYDGIGDESFALIRAIKDKFPETAIEMYAFNETFAIHLTELASNHFTNQGIRFQIVSDPSEAKLPWAKAMLGCNESFSREIQAFIKENFDDPCFLPTSGNYVELLKKGVNKGTGLLKLADYLGISHNNCFAVGDGYNDVDMLLAAAAGFVPSNGSREALEVATHIVRPNSDDAVANVIEILDSIY